MKKPPSTSTAIFTGGNLFSFLCIISNKKKLLKGRHTHYLRISSRYWQLSSVRSHEPNSECKDRYFISNLQIFNISAKIF